MTTDTARVIEIFSSIQGEGALVGIRQVFVRFVGCNIHCVYCDTPQLLFVPDICLVETSPGSREFLKIANPVTAGDLLQAVERFASVPHHSVSLTGGEPLVHASFLREFLPRLKSAGWTTYLETNGILFSQLESVIEWVDIISMDIKLPQTLDPAHDYFTEHEEFLRAAKTKEVFAKLVVTPETPDTEIVRASELVASVDPSIPLILQPVTPEGDIIESPSSERMLEVQEAASRILHDVRVIPQVHRLIGMI